VPIHWRRRRRGTTKGTCLTFIISRLGLTIGEQPSMISASARSRSYTTICGTSATVSRDILTPNAVYDQARSAHPLAPSTAGHHKRDLPHIYHIASGPYDKRILTQPIRCHHILYCRHACHGGRVFRRDLLALAALAQPSASSIRRGSQPASQPVSMACPPPPVSQAGLSSIFDDVVQ
jgi:hypothetical protein